MKGKDFFSRKSKSDMFETPKSMTWQLLENEKFDYNKKILEPASGRDAIINVITDKFKYISKGDIIYSYDFFKENNKYDYIITNPPYSLWDEFVKKAKIIATEKFAFLGRIEFLTGIKRFNERLYNDPEYPLTKIYLFVRKVNLSFTEEYNQIRDDGKYPTGMFHYSWFIFEKNNGQINLDQIPVIKMIDNNPYILRKNKK